jgi:3-hydroxyacyl-CoA dehydrogenase/enoyl-CoA hydratase/3-hydroxybutyryl-CoA epimerase
MESPIQVEIRECGVALVTLDLPGERVNKLTSSVMARFSEVINEVSGNQEVHAIIIRSGKEGIFIAGADIREIEGIEDPKEGKKLAQMGQEILDRLESLPIPVIAAIDGACLGGGMELALACHYRIVTDHPKTVLGQPEVKLGVIPGFGATQRLPRLIGIQKALGLILTGKNLYPRKAGKLGFADEVVPREILMETVVKFATGLMGSSWKRPQGMRRKKDLMEKLLETSALGRQFIFKKAREETEKQTKGHYPAPLKAIEAVEEGLLHGMEAGLTMEAKLFGETAATDVSKNLIKVFYLQEEFKKDRGVADADVAPLPVKKVGVLGAGVMGGGIAELFGEKEIPVRMKDISTEAVASGLRAAYTVLAKKKSKRVIDRKDLDRKFGKISGTTKYSGFRNADVLVEAVVEKMDIKKQVLAEIGQKTGPNAIFATNTSSLSVTELATAAKNREKVVGMHFFNPVDKMPLVEVIRGEKTSDETVATIVALSKKLGKTPVVVKDREGFLVNRILMPYLNEGALLVEEGVGIETVDRLMLDFGMPMGVFILLDAIGLDVALKVAEILHGAHGDRMKPSIILSTMVEAGRFGKKNDKGFYTYQGKQKRLSPETEKLISRIRRGPSGILEKEISRRLLLTMINEAAMILAEGVADRPSVVDAGMIFGVGFPPFRGGLLRYADDLGAAAIRKDLEDLAERFGERFRPAELIQQMADTGERFYPVV